MMQPSPMARGTWRTELATARMCLNRYPRKRSASLLGVADNILVKRLQVTFASTPGSFGSPSNQTIMLP